MPDSENWEKYGFPDDIAFMTVYKPMIGLIKALNERLEAVDLSAMAVPEIFSIRTYMPISYLQDIDAYLFQASMRFVDPDKISSAQGYADCFWDWDDLMLEAADGISEDIVSSWPPYNPLMTAFPVKFAEQRYKAINLLRYVVTTESYEWPAFSYEDRNNTFNFKE